VDLLNIHTGKIFILDDEELTFFIFVPLHVIQKHLSCSLLLLRVCDEFLVDAPRNKGRLPQQSWKMQFESRFCLCRTPAHATRCGGAGSVALPNVTISAPFESVDELCGTPPMVVDVT
jgi:hypothetical protein